MLSFVSVSYLFFASAAIATGCSSPSNSKETSPKVIKEQPAAQWPSGPLRAVASHLGSDDQTGLRITKILQAEGIQSVQAGSLGMTTNVEEKDAERARTILRAAKNGEKLSFDLIDPKAIAVSQPLFTFEEDGDIVSFWAPNKVQLVRYADGSKKTCENQLPEMGNMWSGKDVVGAFRNDDVQNSLRTTRAPYSSANAAKLTADSSHITWASECDKCLAQPAGVKHLQTVLHTVMLNSRLLCP